MNYKRYTVPLNRFIKEEAFYYIKSPDKKPFALQAREAYALWANYNFIPYHYFKSHLYLKDFEGVVSDYVPPKLVERLQEAYNSEDALPIVRDKAKFQAYFTRHGLACIATSWTVDVNGILRDDAGNVVAEEDFLAAVASFGNRVFLKPIAGSQGHGARILDFGAGDVGSVRSFRKFIVQPVLAQHEAMRQLFAGSVNTIRLDTFLDAAGCHHNVCALRLGTGDMIIDNWAAGGIVIGVNIDTGRLYPFGRRHNKFGEYATYHRHPDTGVVFKDYQIPCWPEVRALARAAALAVPSLRCLCWDIAVTPEGPVLIEANDHWSVNMLQTAWGGIRHTRLGQEALRRHGVADGA